jgi:hypothetical protein
MQRVLVLPYLLCSSKLWTVKGRDINRILSVLVRYSRSVKGCTRVDHTKNGSTEKELKMQSVQYKTDEHRQSWMSNFNKITNNRIMKQTVQYKPEREREWKRWN